MRWLYVFFVQSVLVFVGRPSPKVVKKDGVVYYEYELTKPHNLISAAVRGCTS